MEYIFTYGGFEAMFQMLNAMASIMNSNFMQFLINLFAFLSVMVYSIQAAYNSSAGPAYRNAIAKALGTMVIILLFLMPRGNLLIHDHVTKQQDSVSNLPWGFVLPVTFVEYIGNLTSVHFEQAFSSINSLPYHKYGMVFGARLISESRKWRSTDPEFYFNFDRFYRRCIMRDISVSKKYTIADLFNGSNSWDLVKSKTSQRRTIEIYEKGLLKTKTCFEAAKLIDDQLSLAKENILERYASSIFASAGNQLSNGGDIPIFNRLLQNTDSIFSKYTNNSLGSTKTLNQILLANSFSIIQQSEGAIRAAQHQEMGWKISAELASIYIPLFLTVCKCLIYASFLFIAPMMVLGSGFKRYINYFHVVISLQLWPALFAVLNLICETYSGDSLKSAAGGVISYATFSTLTDKADVIVTVASGFQMFIPMLAYTLVKSGVEGIVNAASNAMSSMHYAAGTGAAEAVTGNRSFDNLSFGNMQYGNQSAYKTDLNSSFRSGIGESQLLNGSLERANYGTGEMVFDYNQMRSTGPTTIESTDAVQAHLDNSLQDAKSASYQATQSYETAKSHAAHTGSSYLANFAKRESSGEDIEYSKAGQSGKAVQKSVQLSNALKKAFNMDDTTATEWALRASISNGPLTLAKLEASMSASGRSVDTRALSEAKDIVQSANYSESYDTILRGMSAMKYSDTNNIDKSLGQEYRESYENMQRAAQSKTFADHEVATYTIAQGLSQTEGISWRKELNDDVRNMMVKDGYDMHQANKLIKEGSPIAKQYATQIAAPYAESLINKARGMSSNHEKSTYKMENKFASENMPINKDIESNVKNFATNQGFNVNERDFIDNTIKQKANSIIRSNEIVIEQQKAQNIAEKNNLKNEIKDKKSLAGTGKRAISIIPGVERFTRDDE
ncbi:MAG: traG [Rickettsiaceae bacterium]|jgi:hypothetical protein|nr:traG [Rickettsiaceae bacterium]